MFDLRKLDYAFQLMRERGLYAMQELGCCQECGETRCCSNGSSTEWGWVFYSDDEDECMKVSQGLCLIYGAFKDPDRVESADRYKKEIACVGFVVQDCLKLAGLECEWDGDPDMKIVVLSRAAAIEPSPSLSAQERLCLLHVIGLLGNN